MSSMLDALTGGGGGPPPGPPGGAAPYDLDQGPPQGSPPGGDDGGGGGDYESSLQALDVAEDALHAFIQMDPDDIDRSQAASALQTVLKLKAANQKSTQAGDGKSLMRALQSPQGQAA